MTAKIHVIEVKLESHMLSKIKRTSVLQVTLPPLKEGFLLNLYKKFLKNFKKCLHTDPKFTGHITGTQNMFILALLNSSPKKTRSKNISSRYAL